MNETGVTLKGNPMSLKLQGEWGMLLIKPADLNPRRLMACLAAEFSAMMHGTKPSLTIELDDNCSSRDRSTIRTIAELIQSCSNGEITTGAIERARQPFPPDVWCIHIRKTRSRENGKTTDRQPRGDDSAR